MKNDYRLTDFCPKYENISQKKEMLKREILTVHPKQKNFYSIVSKKTNKYYKSFSEIFNKKCAYCGINTEINSIRFFEIDHVVCESSFNDDKIKAGQLENLVFSCQYCNRKKSDFFIDEDYIELLHPENEINRVFKRDEKFNIIISDDFIDEKKIFEFYKKIDFENQSRRLDFLIMSLIGLIENAKDKDIKEKLRECKDLLTKKRNGVVL